MALHYLLVAHLQVAGGLSVKSGTLIVAGAMVVSDNQAEGASPSGFGNGGGLFVTTSEWDDTIGLVVAQTFQEWGNHRNASIWLSGRGQPLHPLGWRNLRWHLRSLVFTFAS